MSDPGPDSPAAILARLGDVLRAHRVTDFALTGGVAVGVWASPRQTRDVDVCGVLPLEEVDRLLALHDGLRSGPGELPDLVRFRVQDWDVDLFVAKAPYDRQCLDRAVDVTIDGVATRIVTAEDLLVHKMMKLRTDRRRLLQDLADVRAVLQARGAKIDWSYLRSWLLPEEARLLEDSLSVSDEDLVARLLRS